MILLDTNVISEPLHQEPNARVIDWIDAQALETLYLSAITVAELRAGVALVPDGKRRNRPHENLEKHLLPIFANRVLSFDIACTKAYAALLAKARAAGLAVLHCGCRHRKRLHRGDTRHQPIPGRRPRGHQPLLAGIAMKQRSPCVSSGPQPGRCAIVRALRHPLPPP